MKKGFVFTTEALLAIGGILVIIAGVSIASAGTATPKIALDGWQQTRVMIDSQSRFLSAANPDSYAETGDYFCYAHYQRTIDKPPNTQWIATDYCRAIP